MVFTPTGIAGGRKTAVKAPLKFVSNTIADYNFVRPSPGSNGEEIFKTLCTSTPPGCEKDHPAPGIPIACAIVPTYEDMQGFHIEFERTHKKGFNRDFITVKKLFISGTNKTANQLKVKKPGQIIAWKWNDDIQEELREYVSKLEKGDEKLVTTRMKGFRYRMVNDLRHEKYHVDKHFIPYFKNLEKVFNNLEYSPWVRKEWEVPTNAPVPEDKILSDLRMHIGVQLKQIQDARQKDVDQFHQQQDGYSNHARNCACYGDLPSCKQMDTFWAY